MIKLDGVSKQYLYGARVLFGMDLTVADGEIVSVLGDEQSGKTTLLKVIAGVTDCEGQVLIDGSPIAKKPDDVIMVFDDLAIFDNRSCYYNLAYPLKIRGLGKDAIDEKVKECAMRVGITASLYERAGKMSLIDKKRLALARLFLRDCKVILVDDITRGLDKDEAKTLWREVEPILVQKAAEGKSVIFATRDKDEALSVADRIVVMHYREVKQIGKYCDIMRNPSNVWAAQAFDEDYHFEKATLEEVDGELVCNTLDGHKIDVSHLCGKVAPEYIGKTVLAGWQSDCFDVDGGRKVKADYSIATTQGYALMAGEQRIFSKQNLQQVGTLPLANAARLFDETNENSIVKGSL